MSKPQQNMSKLSYRIRSFSSEEQTHPANELLMQSPSSKGWQSARFCDYPQEIVLQFMSPVRIRQLQFLSHQYKISSRIEIFVYMPDQNTPFINTEFKYRKLGYLSLDSNERTGYKSRELKSVYVDSPCLYMKLSFHKNHNNVYNTFNQIGVIALSCFGDVLSNMQERVEPPKEYYNQIQFQTQFDNVTLDRLRTLEIAKERAVKIQDFDEAKRLKEAIDKLKQIGIQLRQLNERKEIAVENQDYDAAKIIKAEIDRLRNAVAPEYLLQKPVPLQYNSNIPYNPGQFQPLSQEPISAPSMNQVDNWNNKPASKANNFKNQFEDDNFQRSRIEEQPLVEQEIPERFNQDNDRPINVKQQPKLEESKQDKIQQKQFQEQFNFNNRNLNQGNNHDEAILPAMKNQVKKQPWEHEDAFANGGGDQGGQQEQTQAEQLTNDARKLADPLIPIIGEECAAKVFSKSWQIREEALKWLEAESQNPRSIQGNDPQQLFTAILGVCSATLGDKVANVTQGSMNLLQAVCNSRSAKPTSVKGETGGYVDNCMTLLMEQAGNHVPKVREQAEASLFALGSVSIVGNQAVVQALSKGSGLKPKLLQSIKHIVGRLNILQQFAKRFSIGKKDVPLNPVMEFAVKQMTHPNAEIRNAAISLITEAYHQVGEQQVDPFISGLPEQQREILQNEFSQQGNGKKSAPEVKETKKTVISTNIQHQGARQDDKSKKGKQVGGGASGKSPSQKEGKKTNQSKQQQNDSMESKVCEFCNEHNPEFAEKKNMDIHLWRECPMLLFCSHCAQVVEVSTYNQHLLEECSNSMKYRQCTRCKEAVEVNQYNDHVSEKACMPFKSLSVANRCPLCHVDIEQGPEGWRKHLVNQGCPNNQRSAG